jgi:hypothetical protein
MQLPVLIESLPAGVRYRARMGEPFNLSAEAATPEEALHLLQAEFQRRLGEGARIAAISFAPSSPTLEVQQESEMVRANGNGAASRELPVADFMEPIEYGWTESGFEARQALKRYCEDTHADY